MHVMEKRMKAYSLLALALVVSWAPDDSLAQGQDLSEIHTLALDSGDGMESRVILIRSDESRRQLGITKSNGVLTLEQAEPCDAGMVLEAEPSSAWYKKGRKNIECTDPEIIEMQRVQFARMNPETENLLKNTDYTAAIDDPALAALLYNELAARVASADQDLSHDYAERAVYAWANATDFFGEPVVPSGGSILTSDIIEHAKQYQKSMGLKPTGLLDYQTFATTADRDIFWFLLDVYPEPGTVSKRSESILCERPTSSDAIAKGESPLVTTLVRAAEEKERAGEYGNAALLFNETRARVGDDTTMAIYTEPRVYENAGRALNVLVPTRCDPFSGGLS